MTSDVDLPPAPRYCARCGGALALRFVEEEGSERLVCGSCSAISYVNPRVVASVIPERVDGEGRRSVLLMRRALEPRRGYWSPPGGFVEMGESTEEAALREGEEEVGVALELLGLLGVYSRPEAGIVSVVYRARALTDEPRPSAEALEARWFREVGIPWDDLAFETTARALRDWAAQGEG